MRGAYRSLRRPRYRFDSGWRHWLAQRVLHRRLWRPERQASSLGLALGLAVAMLPPAPIQMLVAASLAVLCRANIPLAVAAVWVSNPVTWPLIIPFQLKLGRNILPLARQEYGVGSDVWEWLEPLCSMTVGVLLTAAVVGVCGYLMLYLPWALFSSGKRDKESR